MRSCSPHILCCENPTYDSVTEVFYSLKAEMGFIGSLVLRDLWYGTRLGEVWTRYKKLQVLHSVLSSIRAALVKQGALCLSCIQVNSIVEAVRSELGMDCSKNSKLGLEVDVSGKAGWSIKNPFCVPFEHWESSMYEICELIGIDVVRMDKKAACDLSYAVVTKSIPCEIFVEIVKKYKDCTIKYDIFTDSKTCDIKYQGVVSKKECKVAYKALVKSTLCDVGFHEYVNVMNCGVKPEFIQQVYSCGMKLRYDKTKACPVLVSARGVEYYFSDFNVVNESDIWTRLNSLNIA